MVVLQRVTLQPSLTLKVVEIVSIVQMQQDKDQLAVQEEVNESKLLCDADLFLVMSSSETMKQSFNVSIIQI